MVSTIMESTQPAKATGRKPYLLIKALDIVPDRK